MGSISTINNGLEDILDLKFGTLYHLILETLETLKNFRGKLSVGHLKRKRKRKKKKKKKISLTIVKFSVFNPFVPTAPFS